MNNNNIMMLLSHFMFCLIKGEISIPEFICDKSHDIADNKTSGIFVGALEGAKINFRLNFERIGNPCGISQRCNLMIWKVVRDFEKYLNNYPHAQTQIILFNNSMLLPGLRYNFNISVTQRKAVKRQQLSLDFVDSSYATSSEKIYASVSLVGSSSANVHMPYILNANVEVCLNTVDYYIEWNLLDPTLKILETFPDKGTELTISPYTFQGGKSYMVKCTLIKMENDEALTTDTKLINIKDEGLIVKLPMQHTTMKVQQAINIKPYIADLGNHDGDVEIKWSCRFKEKTFCENNHDDSLNIEGGFLDEGIYEIHLTVSKGPFTKSDMCKVEILRDVPSIEIDTVRYPIVASSGFQIKANIEDLRTFCTMQWSSLHYPSFDLGKVPGHVDQLVEVMVKRDAFLREFEEFSTDVANKEHNLIIPPPTGDWEGLPKEDQNYKLTFMLEVKCPKVQLQDNVEVEYSEAVLNDTLSVFASVDIDVNVPPKIQPLVVEPTSGVALETTFVFETQPAIQTGTEPPFMYRFGYSLGDREFIFCNMLDYVNCETALPYVAEGINTFLEVCDSFNSCGKMLGPIIDISVPEQINETKTVQVFKEKIATEDFYKAFGYALGVLYTSKVLKEDATYMDKFFNEIIIKIQFLLENYKEEANWVKRANKLIKSISDFNKELSFNNNVLNELASLRMKLVST